MVNDYHLPRLKNRDDARDYFVQFTRMTADPVGTWTFRGPVWSEPKKHVDKEMKAALLAQKTAEEANTAALRSMKLGYDKLYSAEQRTLKLKKLLRTEIANGTMTVRQAGKELLNYRANLQKNLRVPLTC